MKTTQTVIRLACLFALSLGSGYAWAVWAPTNGGFNFRSIDYPGATGTAAVASNSHQIVGYYLDSKAISHGFLMDRGGFRQSIDYPTATQTVADGINASSQIVGYYLDVDGIAHGFLYIGGSFTPIDYPGAIYTQAREISESGEIVGDYDGAGLLHGFLYVQGVFTSIDYPGALGGTVADGINTSGQIVGYYANSPGSAQHGFLLAGTTFTEINYPAATATFVYGINSTGQIVGEYDMNGIQHGFLGVGAGSSIDYPGAVSSVASGINSSGQIVGQYVDSKGALHGFLAFRQDSPHNP